MACSKCSYWYVDDENPYYNHCTLYAPCIQPHPELRGKQLELNFEWHE